MSEQRAFDDQYNAGNQLANELINYTNRNDMAFWGLSSGGVPVACEVAFGQMRLWMSRLCVSWAQQIRCSGQINHKEAQQLLQHADHINVISSCISIRKLMLTATTYVVKNCACYE